MKVAERIIQCAAKRKEKRLEQKRNWYEHNKQKINTSRKSDKLKCEVVSKWALLKRKQRQKERDRLEKQRERKRKSRQNANEKTLTTIHPADVPVPIFKHRMDEHRAVKKVETVLPQTPKKRKSVLKKLLKNDCSSPDISEKIIRNIKEIMTVTKRKRSNGARTAINILTAAVSGENIHKEKPKVARKLGIKTERVYAGYKKRQSIFNSENASFLHTCTKVRSDAISEENKKNVYDWWISQRSSRASPNKCDYKRKRTGTNMFLTHQVYILEKTQTEIYTDFKENNPDIKISQRVFEKLKPYFVRPMKIKDRQTCCCRKHVEARMILRKCMEFRRKVQSTYTDTDFRQYPVFEHLGDAVEESLCEKELEHHRIECIDRLCADCGVKKLLLMDEECKPGETKTEWERYEYKDVAVKGQQTRRKLIIVKKCTSPHEMFNYFIKLMKSFPAHQFRANWQADQLNTLKDSLPINTCLVIHDFSENYRCIQKEELQSTYFSKLEVTIHVSVLYRHPVLELEEDDDNNNIVTEVFFVLSDDPVHDHMFVNHVQKEISEYLTSINCNVKHMIEFTDGCSAQYKSRHCMGLSSQACSQFGYESFTRNFFETSHGKGPQDAAGGMVKRQLDVAVMKGEIIQNAHDAYLYLSKNLTEPKGGVYKRRLFRYVSEVDRSNKTSYLPIPQNRKIHQLSTTGNNKISVRALSCYNCEPCLNARLDECMNFHMTGCLRHINVRKSNKGEEIDMEEEDELDEKTAVKDLVKKGDVIAVYTTDDSCDYYLLRVNKATHVLETEVNDDWGNHFLVGGTVIQGVYFTQAERSLKFKIIPRQTAIVHAEAAFYILKKEQSKKSISLSEDEHMDIIYALNEIKCF